jgi:ParB family transcriptional regulator, chromosome partitioning protein
LAASILAHGLLHNLTVVEQCNQQGASSGKIEVGAGGRRFAALQRLAKEKKLPKSFAVPCKVVEASAAVEASLAENTIRVAMHPVDQFIAFRDFSGFPAGPRGSGRMVWGIPSLRSTAA